MSVVCVVLAGGEGRRMGGHKPLRRLGEATLIDHALGLARLYADDVAVAVRDRRQIGERRTVLLTDDPAIVGPLAGVASALAYGVTRQAERVLTIPCDAPRLPGDLRSRLEAALDIAPRAGAAVASSAGRLHPVCVLWRSTARDRLRDYVASGARSLRGFAEVCGAVEVAWDASLGDPFANANTPEELAALQPDAELLGG